MVELNFDVDSFNRFSVSDDTTVIRHACNQWHNKHMARPPCTLNDRSD